MIYTKSKFFGHIIFALFAVIFFSAANCNISDDDEYYKLVIFSYNDSFMGAYTIDGDLYPIETGDIKYENNIYYYEKFLGSLTTLEVDVAGVSTTTSFLKIVLYQDDENVGSATGRPGDNIPAQASFSYTAPDTSSE